MNSSLIGVGIITCNRVNYLKNLLDTIKPCLSTLHEIVIVNDGSLLKDVELNNITVLQNEKNLGVAKSKNKALKHLLNEGCEYFFLIEDDMLIKSPDVFNQYVQASIVTGIQHFNYGPGSPFNRKQRIKNYDLHNRHELEQDTEPNPKLIIDYKTCKIALYEHTVAMFSFFTKKLLDQGLGYMCEDFDNCWEHVSSTNYIIKAGYHPPFWWFADLANSHELIEEAKGAIDNSAIAQDKDAWMKKVIAGREIYKIKHGHYPNEVIPCTEEQVITFLKKIKPKLR